MLAADVEPGYLYDRSCLWDRATLMPLWARGGQEAFAYDQSCLHLGAPGDPGGATTLGIIGVSLLVLGATVFVASRATRRRHT